MQVMKETLDTVSAPACSPAGEGVRIHLPERPSGCFAQMNPDPFLIGRWAIPVSLLAALVWTYQATLGGLFIDWHTDDNYSVGQLVPLAALYLLWHDRQRLARYPLVPCWWGAAVILIAQAMRVFGLVELYESAERYSLILTVSGLVLLVAGRDIFRRTLPVQLFLLLMIPLPGRIHDAISSPLQTLATEGAVAALELLGIVVTREGNVMLLNDTVHVAVAEACSGLRMLTAFVMVAAVFAYVVDRPRWQKAALLVSSIPVAILCNLIRLVVTALLFLWTSSQIAERFFHDFAGLTMMPLAVLILVGELWVMSLLVVENKHEPNQTGL